MANKKPVLSQLSVHILPGLFPTERAIRFKGSDGEEVSAFVSATQLNEADSVVRITVLEKDTNNALVQIPSQGGTRVAKVPLSEVRYR